MKKKRLPVGQENFTEIISNDYYYVDKTLLIKELLEKNAKVNLFTRPRRFGKSLNINMLKAFFEIGCDRSLFSGLKISMDKELCQAHMGKYPVIALSLKSVEGFDYETAKEMLRYTIGTEAERFSFLAESPRLTENDKKKYQSLVRLEEGAYCMNEALLVSSLQILSMLLSKHYQKKTVVLIDEYDVPLDKAFQAGYYEKMLFLLRGILANVLKGNEHLEFAVLTGCLRISKESIFTGLNNINVYSIADIRYEEYFGFTDAEVRTLLEYYQLTEHFEVIREWYDGYQFGSISVYCPWDVINYCDRLLDNPEKEPENYWANTSGNEMVRRFIDKADQQTRREIELLISGKSIRKSIHMELTYNDLDSSIENLWSILFTTGYLTGRGSAKCSEMELSIPNQEIRELFVSKIREWFKDLTRADGVTLKKFCEAFPQGASEVIENILGQYLWKSIGIRDTAVRKKQKENFYHGMLLGLLQYENHWLIRSNAETGEGFSDILIETPERVGIVIEIKYADGGNLGKSCEDALAQIEQRSYSSVLLADGMESVLKYGIAFYKKRCKVMMET